MGVTREMMKAKKANGETKKKYIERMKKANEGNDGKR